MKKFIVWYKFDLDEEDYTIIEAIDEDEARRKFRMYHDNIIVEAHEISENESYLEYC